MGGQYPTMFIWQMGRVTMAYWGTHVWGPYTEMARDTIVIP